MRAKAWRYAVRGSVAALAVMLVVARLGQMVRHGMLKVSGSATSERFAMIRVHGVGYARVSDPTGYAIPYRDRWDEVIDPAGPSHEVSRFGTMLLFFQNEYVWTNRQGNPVTVHWWHVSFIPWAALSVLVIGAELSGTAYRRAATMARARRARQREQRYSQDERCPACGYDVRESAERCPECGQAFVRWTVILPAPSGTA